MTGAQKRETKEENGKVKKRRSMKMDCALKNKKADCALKNKKAGNQT